METRSAARNICLLKKGLSCTLGRGKEGEPKLASEGLACTLQEDSTKLCLVLLSMCDSHSK